MKKMTLCVAAACFLLPSSTSFAAFEDFAITLSGGQEVGGGGTGSGSGTLTFDTVANTLTFNSISYSGLSANSVAAHIHGPANPGVNANVLYDLSPGFTTLGGPAGTIGGTLTLIPVFSGTNSFSVAQQVAQLETGQWYINIHSTAFPNGEIRGQITQAVPEPSALAFVGLGIAIVCCRRRRQ